MGPCCLPSARFTLLPLTAALHAPILIRHASTDSPQLAARFVAGLWSQSYTLSNPIVAFLPSLPTLWCSSEDCRPLALLLTEAWSWFGEVGTHWKSPLVPGHRLGCQCQQTHSSTPLQNTPLLKTQRLLSCWKQQISTDTIHIKLTIKLQFNIPRQQWLLTASKACNPI